MLPKKPNLDIWPIFTVSGLVAYLVLYITATYYYPGGSSFDEKQSGFNWTTNYWCELLGRNAKNGQANLARPFGMAGMSMLVISLSTFWYNLPKLIPINRSMDFALKISGVISMMCSLFIFSYWHDLVIYIAVTFGSIAFVLSMYGLYSNQFYRFFGLCITCLVLILINNIIYISEYFINYLPVIQKITFVFVFLWIALISLYYLNQQSKIHK